MRVPASIADIENDILWRNDVDITSPITEQRGLKISGRFQNYYWTKLGELPDLFNCCPSRVV